MNPFNVKKASGDLEVFAQEKLLDSLQKSGANRETALRVLEKIQPYLYDGIPTRELYKHAFKLLKKSSYITAAKYSLKSALFQLGPEGFAFEKLIGEVFRKQGFEITNNIFVDGRCVRHEIDVFGVSENNYLLVECKFHNLTGTLCNVKTALYVKARALDVAAGPKGYQDFRLITNTKFSGDAQTYAECSGLKILGWNYPHGNGLKDLISRYHIHPITCLTTLTAVQKKNLLSRGIVLCQNLLADPSSLKLALVHESKVSRVLNEIESLLGEK